MNENEIKRKADELVGQIKEMVKKGNIARIMVKHEENTILNIPLNAGIAGAMLGLTAAPWTLIATSIATLGFDCKIELEKTDGQVVELLSRDVGEKAVNLGSAVVEEVRDRFHKE